MLAFTTMISIAGAYAIGRARRRERLEERTPDTADQLRVARMERMLETMAEEIERLGESQRFLVKIMNVKQISPGSEAVKPPKRIITPH
jgi:hypothetical protein